jgi:hypothetical protein
VVADAVYVYGVSDRAAPDLSSLHGVEDAAVESVQQAGLVALVSPLRRGKLAARDLRAHWRVLERAFDETTVLPVRFGTVMESEAAVRERLLEPNAERLSALLEEMRGLVQLNLKGRYDEDALLRQILRESPSIAKLRERMTSAPGGATPAEQLRVGQLVEAEVARRRELDTELALDALEPAALATHLTEVSHPAAFDLAFLVARDREKGFSEAVRALRERLRERIEIRYVGPLPPFSFARADLTGGGEPWA